MSRSVWKLPFVSLSLQRNLFCFNLDKEQLKAKKKRKKKFIIRTRSRSSVITWEFVGKTVSIYNGIRHVILKIRKEMVGFKLGEFSPTRLLFVLRSKKKKKKI